jgi:hypothetical protein
MDFLRTSPRQIVHGNSGRAVQVCGVDSQLIR